MKLSEHTEHIRQLIDKAFRNRLGRMGISNSTSQPIENVAAEYLEDRKRVDIIRGIFISETGNENDAFEKLIEEFTFTLFNRIAALKVMEAHTLHPEIITKRTQHGDRSFSHLLWLEQNSEGRNEDQEGLIRFFLFQLNQLASDIPLFSPTHPYHLLPTAVELNSIINAFNDVELDPAVSLDIWQSDDVLGWLYESYNNYKKAAHKESGDKTEFNKVSIQSQVYTPRWVVKFLVDNSLGKTYLEMFPDSEIKRKYRIANAPRTTIRERKQITEIKLIDPAMGSGNFLLYAFDLFFDMYTDQNDNYGANYDLRKIPELIIQNNLHGVDLDDRAVQLAQLGLFIKAKRKNSTTKIEHFNLVSSDFYLPPYEEVEEIFEANSDFDTKQQEVIRDIWSDLHNAYKFGALIRLEEKLNFHFHGLIQDFQATQIAMFTEETLANFEQFRTNFFINLQKAVAQNAAKQGTTFLNVKTQDAISFLQLLTQKYDVAVANPPYTDSADFGIELRKYIDINYKEPNKFNSNLYATFIKRCSELVLEKGFVGMLHPLTFMYISSFKDVRKFILANTHIEILAELGLGGVFANSDVQADVVAYILKNTKAETPSIFLDFKKYKNQTDKPEIFSVVYSNLINNVKDAHIFFLLENSFKVIQDSPFIYWVSDGFREKFKEKTIVDLFNPAQGAATTNNNRFLRFWWEVDRNNISINYNEDKKRWIKYSKGGPFNKWYGNIWVLLDYKNAGQDLIEAGAVLRNSNFYLKEGITYSASGSKGASYRYLPVNCVFDTGGSCIFLEKNFKNLNYLIAFLNSTLSTYIVDCLNPTVNTQVGDLQRVPFVIPSKDLEDKISSLALQNITIKQLLCTYRITETNYNINPLLAYNENGLKDRLIRHLNYENGELTKVLLNEAIINRLIFQVYELSVEDQKLVESNKGVSIGDLPVYSLARQEFLAVIEEQDGFVIDHINSLSEKQFDELLIKEIKDNFNGLYQGNSNLEEFCIKYQVNPINIWYWFKESKVLPDSVPSEYTLEFLADAFRTLLMADDDGIIPLVGLPGEPRLLDRLEQHCFHSGFSSAQFMQLDNLLGKPINQYIEHHFFGLFSDHIKLFKQLPPTPFIWHISSGENQGFEVYIIIYKWNQDSLFKLKSHYIANRKENLQFREIQLQDSETAQAQSEKELIRNQLLEIDVFTRKIDELIDEGYNPLLDDGVAKNISPLQKKGLLKTVVLNKAQLEKYLKADW